MGNGGGNGIGSFEHLKEPNGVEGARAPSNGHPPSGEEEAFQAAIRNAEANERKRKAKGS